MLAAAFFYSLATVRLSRLAPSVPSLPLATAKSLALAGVSLIWLGGSALNNVTLKPSGSSFQCILSTVHACAAHFTTACHAGVLQVLKHSQATTRM